MMIVLQKSKHFVFVLLTHVKMFRNFLYHLQRRHEMRKNHPYLHPQDHPHPDPHNFCPRPDLYILERLLLALIVALQRSPRLKWPARAVQYQPPPNPVQYQTPTQKHCTAILTPHSKTLQCNTKPHPEQYQTPTQCNTKPPLKNTALQYQCTTIWNIALVAHMQPKTLHSETLQCIFWPTVQDSTGCKVPCSAM